MYASPVRSPDGSATVPLSASYATRTPSTRRATATAGSSRPSSSSTVIRCVTVGPLGKLAGVRIRPASRYVAPTRQVTPS